MIQHQPTTQQARHPPHPPITNARVTIIIHPYTQLSAIILSPQLPHNKLFRTIHTRARTRDLHPQLPYRGDRSLFFVILIRSLHQMAQICHDFVGSRVLPFTLPVNLSFSPLEHRVREEQVKILLKIYGGIINCLFRGFAHILRRIKQFAFNFAFKLLFRRAIPFASFELASLAEYLC